MSHKYDIHPYTYESQKSMRTSKLRQAARPEGSRARCPPWWKRGAQWKAWQLIKTLASGDSLLLEMAHLELVDLELSIVMELL